VITTENELIIISNSQWNPNSKCESIAIERLNVYQSVHSKILYILFVCSFMLLTLAYKNNTKFFVTVFNAHNINKVLICVCGTAGGEDVRMYSYLFHIVKNHAGTNELDELE
jgi:hypothetical protein